MKEIKKFFIWVKKNWILSVFFILSIGIFLFGIIVDLIQGWSGEKTLRYIFGFVVILCGISIVFPLQEYKLHKSTLIVRSNNELYRYLERIEKEGRLDDLKMIMDREAKSQHLSKINARLKEYYPDHKDLGFEEVEDFFLERKFFREPYNVNKDYIAYLYVDYASYEEAFSEEFEEVYSKYKSRDLVRPAKFPLFDCILPLILAILGLFATVYSSIYITEELKVSLIVYIGLFVEIAVLSFMSGSIEHRGVIQEQVEKMKK